MDHIRAALSKLDRDPRLVFTAHSIPDAMAANCDYVDQLLEAGRLIAEALEVENWRVVYQSRSGSPSQPWLGPDIVEHLRELNDQGVRNVVVAPIGFVSDHMEVVYDLDYEAQNAAKEMGMTMVRASTAGTHPAFVKMIRELMLERIDNSPARSLGSRGPVRDVCPADCCLPAR